MTNKPSINFDAIFANFAVEYSTDPGNAIDLAMSALLDPKTCDARIAFSELTIRELVRDKLLTTPVESDSTIREWAELLGQHGIRVALDDAHLSVNQVHAVLRHPLGLQIVHEAMTSSDILREDDQQSGDVTRLGGTRLIRDGGAEAIEQLRMNLRPLIGPLLDHLEIAETDELAGSLLHHLVSLQLEPGQRYRNIVGPECLMWAIALGQPTAKAEVFDEHSWREVAMTASLLRVTEGRDHRYPGYIKRLIATKPSSPDDILDVELDTSDSNDFDFKEFRRALVYRVRVEFERLGNLAA